MNDSMIKKEPISYEDTFDALNWCFSNKASSFSEKEMLGFMQTFKTFLYTTIHEKLDNDRTEYKETIIRKYVRYVIIHLLPYVKKTITKNIIRQKTEKLNEDELLNFNSWLDIEDDLYAIASFRSLTHLALYLERQDDVSDKVWCYTMKDTMGGIFYYANAMILNNSYQNMIKQCPTGYGKTKSDCVIMSFVLGYDMNANIMKVVGNPKLVGELTERLVKMLKSEKFGKVFPKFGKYNGSDAMFKTLKINAGEFLLKDCKKARTFLCVNKETGIDGTRYDYQFYDDVTQSNDRENVNQHMADRSKFTTQWKKRASNEFLTKRFFTGTAYHREDLISYVRSYYANGRPLIKDMQTLKYGWNKFVHLSEDKKTVYCLVPKLADLELGEEKCYCTFPQKYSKDEALKMLHGSLGTKREFYAMEQQQPLPPESLAFDWAYLSQYNSLPKEILLNECECHAIIDPSRKGRDYFSCMIFKKGNNGKYYFVDCYFKKEMSKVAIPPIADILIRHKVDTIHIESNIDCIELLENALKRQQYTKYQLDDFYSTEKKDDKISRMRDDIRDNLVFPQQGMYHDESDMGKAMFYIVSYSFDSKNLHDDSIDCCAMLCDRLDSKSENTIEVLNIGRIY